MKIAVLNLARMGDILLGGPLLDEIRRRWPDAELHLIVPTSFVAVGEGLGVDAVHGLDQDCLVRASAQDGHLIDLYRQFRTELAHLLELKPDAVINMGYDNPSALIAHLLGGEVLAGSVLDRQGYRRIKGRWTGLVKASHLARGQNPFHLADLHRRLLGDVDSEPGQVRFQTSDDAVQAAQDLLTGNDLSVGDGPLVVLQVGASHPSKRWPAKSFGRVAADVESSQNAHCVFVGIGAEQPLIDEALAVAGPSARSLADQTTVPVLAAVLKQADLVISNDTGTMHLAAAMGTRVLALTFGNALAHETGPWGEGHLVVEPEIGCYPCDFHVQCPHFNCHRTLSPKTAARLAAALLDGVDPATVPLRHEPVTVSRTAFDSNGYWRLEPLHGTSTVAAAELRNQYRDILTPLMSEIAPSDLPLDVVAESHLGDDALGLAVRRGLRACDYLLRAVQDGDNDSLSDAAARVDEARDEILNNHIHRSELHLLLALFRFELEAIDSNDPVQAVTQTRHAFYRLAQGMVGVLNIDLPDGDLTQSMSELSTPPVAPSAEPLADMPNDSFARFQRPRMQDERLTVILFESDYYLQAEIRHALQAHGHRVISIEFSDAGNVIEQLLLASLEADLLITVNHLGFDEMGELATLLERIRLPYVSWYVDRPAYILLDHNAAPGEMAHVYTWEKETIAELCDYGFDRVSYLPLATDPTLFRPGSRRYDGSGPVWVANSMVEPVRDWTHRAGAQSSHEPLLRFMEESLLDERRDPSAVMADALTQFPVISKGWNQRRRIQMTNLASLRATGKDRWRTAHAVRDQDLVLVGDENWTRRLPGVPLHEPIDYGQQLAAFYNGSLQLNSTSFQMPTAVNQRVFDVPASGGVVLTDAQADLNDLFDADNECLTWRTPEEAAEKVRWIRANPDAARAISERSLARIDREHTYTQRITTILDQVRASMRPAVVGRRA